MHKKKNQTSALAFFAVVFVGFSLVFSVMFLAATPVRAASSNQNQNAPLGGFFQTLQKITQPIFQLFSGKSVGFPGTGVLPQPDIKINQADLEPIVQTILKNYHFPAGQTTKNLITRIVAEPTFTTSTVTNTITNNNGPDYSSLGKYSFLYVDSSSSLQTLPQGTAGQLLTSNGIGNLPTWAAPPTGLDWSAPGVIGSLTPNAANFTNVSIAYSGDSGAAFGEGAFNLDNTNNIGNGFTLTTDAGAEATGDLVNVSVTNRNFQNAAFHTNYYGNKNAFEIVNNGDASASNALAVTGNDINDSTLGIIGNELGKGTIKISHYRPPGLNDNNASGISIDLRGAGTAAQGLYVDSTEVGGTTGDLLRLRNQSVDKFFVDYQGDVSQGGYGYNTTYTKYGNTTNDQFFVGTNGSFRVQRAASNSEAFRVQIAGDTQGRWRGTSDGKLSWGDGSDPQDVTLSRTGVGVLNLAGTFQVAANGAGNALLQLNQTGSSDLMTASASGVTKFTVSNTGDLVSANGASWQPLSDSTSALSVANTAGTPFVFFDTANSRVGIGAAPTTAALEVTSGTALFGATSTDQFFIGTNGAFKVTRATSNSEAFRTEIAGDTQGRLLGTSDGRLKWGDGTDTQDVVLRRGAVGQLLLDGALVMNNSNGSVDTVIKGASDSNLFHVVATGDKIGVGLSNPIGAFQISKDGTGNAALIVNQLGTADILTASASGSPKFTIDNSGDVGIGATVPSAKLQVVGGDILLDNTQALRIKDSGGSARPVLAYTSGNNVQLYNYAATGIVQIGINNASNSSNIRFFTGANTEKMRIDNAGVGIGATSFGSGATNVLAIANGTIPTTSITGGVQLYAESVASSSELRVRDEAGNVTTLSPHNFSAIPDGKSEDMAWAFYSQRGDLALNVDMLKTIRTVEALSGQQLVYIKNLQTGEYLPDTVAADSSSSSSSADLSLDVNQSPLLANVNSLITQSTDQLSDQVVHTSDISTYATWSNQVWNFVSEVVFQLKVTFQKETVFLAGAIFHGPITVNADTAGKLTIPAGATKVEVSFTQAFSTTPVVYLSPLQNILGGYSLENVGLDSFVVTLNQAQSSDTQINWLAVMQDSGSSTHSQVLEDAPSNSPASEQTPAQPEVSPTPIPSPSSTPSSNSNSSPTPTPTPTVSPAPTPTPSSSPVEQGSVAGAATTSANVASPSAQASNE